MRELRVVDAMELATAYAAAAYTVLLDRRELPVRVGQRAAALETALPAARYAFLTAWNPASDPRPEDANEAADARLSARLDGLGIMRVPAHAQSPDGRWREPGWLLCGCRPAQVLALAREFGQAGTIEWTRGEPVRLQMLAERPVRPLPGALQSSVDWVGEAATA